MSRSSIHKQRLAKKFALAIACAAPLLASGCASDSNTDWAVIYRAAVGALNRDTSVSLEQAGAIPYATLGVRIGGGPEQILILTTEEGGNQLWSSSRRLAISLRQGRIVRTAGLAGDLSGAILGTSMAAGWYQNSELRWSADFADLGLYSVPITCQLTQRGSQPIAILGVSLETNLVEEVCRSDQLNWSYTNKYWISPTSGTVWRSEQVVHPRGDLLELEILRPSEKAN